MRCDAAAEAGADHDEVEVVARIGHKGLLYIVASRRKIEGCGRRNGCTTTGARRNTTTGIWGRDSLRSACGRAGLKRWNRCANACAIFRWARYWTSPAVQASLRNISAAGWQG